MRFYTLLLACALMPCTQNFYGPDGRFEGFSTGYGNNQIFQGPSGQYLGTAQHSENSTIYSGPSGQYEGFSTGISE